VRDWVLTVAALLVLFYMLFATPAPAEEAPSSGADERREREADDLIEIVVTATRREAEEFDVPRHVSVVTLDKAREKGAMTVPDALREEPGVHVQKTCQGGGSPFIRGMTGQQILILLDGMRFNNSGVRYGPNQYLNTIDPNTVGRIEIVHGPGSVLYGSDALGGTVNVITDKHGDFGEAPEPGVDVRLFEQYSSANRGTNTRVDLVGGAGHTNYSLGLGTKHFGDLRAGRGDGPVDAVDVDGLQPHTGYDEYSISSTLRHVLAANQELRAAYLFTRQVDVPRSDKLIASKYNTSPELRYLYNPQVLELGYVEYEGRDLGRLGGLKANVSWNRQHEGRERTKSGWPVDRIRYEKEDILTLGTSVQASSREMGPHTVTGGFEYYHDRINASRYEDNAGVITWQSPRFPDGTTYATWGFYVQDEIAANDKLDLTVGMRYSGAAIDTDFGSTTFAGGTVGPFGDVEEDYSDFTWSLEGVCHVTDETNLFLSIARGFRAPTTATIAVDGEWNAGDDIPNPDLDSEYVLSYEIGVKHEGERFAGGASVFYSDYEDLMDRAFVVNVAGTDYFQYENIGEAYVWGGELWARGYLAVTEIGDFSAFGSVAGARGENQTGDEPIRRIPPLRGQIGLRWELPEKSAAWAELYVEAAVRQDRLSSGDVSDTRIPEGGTPGWGTLNLRGGVKLSEKATLTLGAYNLGDKRYRYHGSGIDAPGLNIVVGLELGF